MLECERERGCVDSSHPSTIDEQIERAVARTVERLLAPYLIKLAAPEPAVYTVAQVATVLQVSPDTVGRLVKRGALPRVPHLEGKVLIPRRAVEHLVESAAATGRSVGATGASINSPRRL